MKKITYLSAFLSLAGSSFGQLCTPAFANGCFSWNTKSVEMASINWTFDEVDCTASDYTNLSTVIAAGVPTPMTVSAGNWCGCSVWVDFNGNNQFDNSENLFYEGNGSTEVNVFDFSIEIPTSTINGNYILRVISSWGSDGFTPGDNGSGGCGDYQYGNFVDFSIQVTGGQFPLGISEQENSLKIAPNPAMDKLTIENKDLAGRSFSIVSLDGTEVTHGTILATEQEIAINTLKPGVYFIKLEKSGENYKFVKL